MMEHTHFKASVYSRQHQMEQYILCNLIPNLGLYSLKHLIWTLSTRHSGILQPVQKAQLNVVEPNKNWLLSVVSLGQKKKIVILA